MRIKKVHKKVTYIEDKQRHMANDRKSRRNQSKGKRTNTTIRIQVNICKIKKNVKLHNERAHGIFENISTITNANTYSLKNY